MTAEYDAPRRQPNAGRRHGPWHFPDFPRTFVPQLLGRWAVACRGRCSPAVKVGLIILWLVSLIPDTWAQTRAEDLTEASLEELMNIKVTSVSKKEQSLSKVAAAIFVVTQEDIRRSGAENIPDLLRMVPGLEVAQIDANAWAITSRGFNARQANKLLVLIDGRTVYTPWSNGVFWDMQDVPLFDIDRIEVIRGPGATVWGANAVNGVINVITKRAQTTQGAHLEAGMGTQAGAGLVQYGGKVRRTGYYRVFARYFNYNNLVDTSNQRTTDGWHGLHGGFRSDWELSGRDSVTLQGDISKADEGQTISTFVSLSPPFQRDFRDPIRTSGGNLLGRWSHTFSKKSETQLQWYYARDRRLEANSRRRLGTFDLDFQHHLVVGSRHDFVWGAGYRLTMDNAPPSYTQTFDPEERSDSLYSTFAQDEIRLADRVSLTLGTKVEHNPYTGFEIQPSARVLWAFHDEHALWASVSRAIRQPSRSDHDIRTNGPASLDSKGLIILTSRFGNRELKAEELVAYELGYRAEPSSRLSLDVAMFYNVYYRLRASEPAPSFFETDPPPPHLVKASVFQNKLHGNAYGAEMAAHWRISDRWNLSPGYTWLKVNSHRDASSQSLSPTSGGGTTPRHQFQIRSYVNPFRNVEFDTALYYVGDLPTGMVPIYARLDARLAWRPVESVELSLVGQNLGEAHHIEFNTNARIDAQPGRTVYGKITWWF